jgi:plasmid stability protein
MASITIRQLDDTLKVKLRIQAANHGRSMEEEARDILRTGLATSSPRKMNLAESIRRHIIPLGGVELAIPVREAVRRPPDFS